MKRLLELRMEKGLSQRDVAKILNISQTTYHNWENDVTQPSIEQLIAISSLFEVSVDYLIGNCDDTGIITYKEKTINDEELSVLAMYNKLPQPIKRNIIELMQSIITTNQL